MGQLHHRLAGGDDLPGFAQGLDDSAVGVSEQQRISSLVSRDIGLRSEHGEALRLRLARLRTTAKMIPIADPAWRRLIELIDDAPGTNELVAAVYLVIGTALIDCYEHLGRDCDPLADELTIRFIERTIVPDHRERTAWAEAFLSGRDLDSTYVATVQAMLEDAGGLVVRSDDVPCDNRIVRHSRRTSESETRCLKSRLGRRHCQRDDIRHNNGRRP